MCSPTCTHSSNLLPKWVSLIFSPPKVISRRSLNKWKQKLLALFCNFPDSASDKPTSHHLLPGINVECPHLPTQLRETRWSAKPGFHSNIRLRFPGNQAPQNPVAIGMQSGLWTEKSIFPLHWSRNRACSRGRQPHHRAKWERRGHWQIGVGCNCLSWLSFTCLFPSSLMA